MSVLAPTGIASFDQAAMAAEGAKQAAYAAAIAPPSAPAWNNGTTYSAGAFVSSGGVVYESLVNGNIGNTPASSPSQWQAMTFATQQAAVKAADIAYYSALAAAAQSAGLTFMAASFRLSLATITNSQPWSMVPN